MNFYFFEFFINLFIFLIFFIFFEFLYRLCSKPYVYGHFQDGECNGLQFTEADSIAEVKIMGSLNAIRSQIAGLRQQAENLRGEAQRRMREIREKHMAPFSGNNQTMGIEKVLMEARVKFANDYAGWEVAKREIVLGWASRKIDTPDMAEVEKAIEAEIKEIIPVVEAQVAERLSNVARLQEEQEKRLQEMIAQADADYAAEVEQRKQAAESERLAREEQNRLRTEALRDATLQQLEQVPRKSRRRSRVVMVSSFS